MPKVTVFFGVVLIVLGVTGFMGTGSVHYTALIPAWVGFLLVVLGLLALAPSRKALFMHIAVTVGLLSFIATFKGGVVDYIAMMRGKHFAYPAAVEAKASMSLLMLIFVVLCVRSFIAARASRALKA